MNIYEQINNQVLEGLEKQGMRWFMPWKSGREQQPMNYVTGKYYRGFNPWMLNMVMRKTNWEYNQWMTYKQAESKGGQVIIGSKASSVYFFKVSYKDNKTGK
jgi:antirestriction protein ArdC